MAKILWDQVGTRYYEAGVDHGVLYLPSGVGVPWNGLTGVDEKVEGNSTAPVYFDGAKIYDIPLNDDFAGTLSALTYPDEFSTFDGVSSLGKGLYVENQRPLRFGLSYRTTVGNDLEGTSYGYKIHLLYNLTAISDATTYATTGATADAIEFKWDISAIPEVVPGYRATGYAVIDTRRVDKYLLKDLTDILYGTATTAPRLPPLAELTNFVTNWALITITDNGDDTWTATGPDEYIKITGDTFEISNADATFIDADTYTISTTHV